MKGALTVKVLSLALLSSCAYKTPETAQTPDNNMTHAEFRIAAEKRISWSDTDYSSANSGSEPVHAKILGFNDFHGYLNANQITGRQAGGAAVMAAYLNAESAEVDGRAIIVHAGDMVGASPPVSALMQDEPSMQVLNLLANEHCNRDERDAANCNVVGTPGNHEFDEGYKELLRLIYGGQHQDEVFLGTNWTGVKIPYVSANVVISGSGETLFPPYVVKEIDGIQIAFVGAVLEHTPEVVIPEGVAGLTFLPEAQAINSYVPELLEQDIHAIVVTIHQGTRQRVINPTPRIGAGGLSGKIIDIVQALNSEIDVVVSGHAHGYNNVLVPTATGKEILLTQAFSKGTAYGDIDITLDPVSGDIVEKSAAIMTTWADQGIGLTPDPQVAALVDQANLAVQPLVKRVVGVAATEILRRQDLNGESVLGDLIADAHLYAMDVDMAFTATGGIRGDIDVGDITWGEIFTILPFGNNMIAMTLTGEQIRRVLVQQWHGRKRVSILQIAGFSYTWDQGLPGDDKIVELLDSNGQSMDPLSSYRVGMASFYASGGDGFGVFTEGKNQVVGPLVLDAFVDYIQSLPQPIVANRDGRINRVNPTPFFDQAGHNQANVPATTKP